MDGENVADGGEGGGNLNADMDNNRITKEKLAALIKNSSLRSDDLNSVMQIVKDECQRPDWTMLKSLNLMMVGKYQFFEQQCSNAPTNYRVDDENIETKVIGQVPEKLPCKDLKPFKVGADGNCLFRSVSVAITNGQTEDLHKLLRLWCIVYGCQEEDFFIEKFLGDNDEDRINSLLVLITDDTIFGELNDNMTVKEKVQHVYRREIMETCKDGRYSGYLQIAVLACLLEINIQQHCIATGHDQYNTLLRPRNASEKTIHLLWCSLVSGSDINHIVPLLKYQTGTSSIEVPQEKLVYGEVFKKFDEKIEEEYGKDFIKESASEVHMIPCVFSNKGTKNSINGTDAERKIYFALKSLKTGFVIHGQKYGGREIDFVHVTMSGLMIVECKGITSPNNAKNKYKYARDQLKKHVKELSECLLLPPNIPILQVVAFPLSARCDIEIVDDTHLLFKEDLNNLTEWLKQLPFLPRNVLSVENYGNIVRKFLMKYHMIGKKIVNLREFKKRGISDCRNSLERETDIYCTNEQAILVKAKHFDSMWIIGAAGTGKTFVLKYRVQFLAEQYSAEEDKLKILAITYNRPINKDIKMWVESNKKETFVDVKTFLKLLWDILKDSKSTEEIRKMKDEKKIECILENKLATPGYNRILVDEAQDLPGDWLTLLKKMLSECERSNIWIFEDPFQVVRKNTRRPQDDGRFTKHCLTKVIRNTKNVFEAYQHCYKDLREQVNSTSESFSSEELSQPTVDHNVYGLSPQYITGEDDDQLKSELVSTLRSLQEKGVALSDVAVITRNVDNDSKVIGQYLVNAGIKWKNAEKDIKKESSDRSIENAGLKLENAEKDIKEESSDRSVVIVESYERFKGLESKVIIFFIPTLWKPTKSAIYVGFSRSFCHLIVIGPSQVIKDIKQSKLYVIDKA